LPDERPDSWKEIAAYLNRDVTTVQRWEKREGMPVHRHQHEKIGSVYAYRAEIDAWARGRNPQGAPPDRLSLPAELAAEEIGACGKPARLGLLTTLVAIVVVGTAIAVWQLLRRDVFWKNPVADTRFVEITDFPGTERAAAVSRDGRFVAFLSDRDGRMDVWVTQAGTGQFYNVTRNDPREFDNPSVRTLGFSPDGSLLTFWVRRPGGSNEIGIWAAPILGGPPRPYLEGVAEFDWLADASRLAYHTPGPGDPLFVKAAGDTGAGQQIFSAPTGLHSHFPVWSPDGRFIYFVQGSLPERMDIWRMQPESGTPERITNHDAAVSHPVFVDSRTLMYLASDANGDGPWLHSIDVERRVAHRLTSGLDRYTSLSASADGRRLVVSRARKSTTLWRLPVADSPTEMAAVRRIPLTTATGFCPRTGPGYLVYASQKDAGDSLWKAAGDSVTQIWSSPDMRIVGCPAIAPDGARVALAIRQGAESRLYVLNSDGTDAQVIDRSLDLQGSPAWSPDGRSITVAANESGVPHLFRVPLDGGARTTLVSQHAIEPTWSPDGKLLLYSGPDVGTAISVGAVTADRAPYSIPKLTLTRGGRHLRFLPGQQALVALRGGIRHKDLWLIDLATGAERQLTRFATDFDVSDFDISPDGREAIVEQVQDQSDIVMIETDRR